MEMGSFTFAISRKFFYKTVLFSTIAGSGLTLFTAALKYQ